MKLQRAIDEATSDAVGVATKCADRIGRGIWDATWTDHGFDLVCDRGFGMGRHPMAVTMNIQDFTDAFTFIMAATRWP